MPQDFTHSLETLTIVTKKNKYIFHNKRPFNISNTDPTKVFKLDYDVFLFLFFLWLTHKRMAHQNSSSVYPHWQQLWTDIGETARTLDRVNTRSRYHQQCTQHWPRNWRRVSQGHLPAPWPDKLQGGWLHLSNRMRLTFTETPLFSSVAMERGQFLSLSIPVLLAV